MGQKRRAWGTLSGRWVPHDTRAEIVDFVRGWSEKCDMPASRLLRWVGIGTSKFHDWKHRFGKVNEQRGREIYPDATPRIITDNGPQFIAKDFKEFIP